MEKKFGIDKTANCLQSLPKTNELTKSLKKRGVGKSLSGVARDLAAKLKSPQTSEFLKSRGL